jgi:hypothetical protein
MTPDAELAAANVRGALVRFTDDERVEIVANVMRALGIAWRFGINDAPADPSSPVPDAADSRKLGPRGTRRLDNHVMSWWLDWTSRYHTRRDYPDVMTREGVTDYAIRTQSDFELVRLELEGQIRVPGRRYRVRQPLMFHDVDGAGVWTFRVRWTGTGEP